MQKTLSTYLLACALFLGALGWLAASSAKQAAGDGGKFVIILQAGRETHEGMARAVHALLYTKELKEHGHDVALVFDGAGTEWAEEWTKADSSHKLTPLYREVHAMGITEVMCDFCAGAFHVKDALKGRQVSLLGEYAGHPSIAKWADRGYQIVVL